MKYKLLLCDVDGTLIPNHANNGVSTIVREAINKASEKIFVGIATARSYTAAYSFLEELHLTSPCILVSGGQIVDPKTKKIILEKIINIEKVLEVIKLLQSVDIKLTVTDYGRELLVTDSYVPYAPLCVYTDPISITKADFLHKKMEDIPGIYIDKAVSWEKESVHLIITNPEASKHSGVLEVARILNIKTQEIIGIGEGYNDYSFLMACGLKIAMGNAVKEVKEIADYIAPTVDEDGVADAIERFMLK